MILCKNCFYHKEIRSKNKEEFMIDFCGKKLIENNIFSINPVNGIMDGVYDFDDISDDFLCKNKNKNLDCKDFDEGIIISEKKVDQNDFL